MLNYLNALFAIIAELVTVLAVALCILVLAMGTIRRVTGRKQILFDPWADLRPQPNQTLGPSVAEMLLFRMHSIQATHERSRQRTEISNTYGDIPLFSQGDNGDIELLRSVDLGSKPGAMAGLFIFALRLIPVLSERIRLKGTIHLYDGLRLQVMLEGYRHPITKARSTMLWEAMTDTGDGTAIPEAVDELAFRIYRDLLRESPFTSWDAFREFTGGLGYHLSYIVAGHVGDRDEAEACYRRALASEPNNAAAHYNLGVLVYTEEEDYSAHSANLALKHFRKALTAPDAALRARAHSAMANTLLTLVGRFHEGSRSELDEALSLAIAAVELEPQLAVAVKARAHARHQLADWLEANATPGTDQATANALRQEARKGYKRALDLDPNYFVAANNLANLLLEWATLTPEGNRGRLAHLLPEWAKLSREVNRGRLLDEAARAAAQSLAISPGYRHAHDNLGNVHLERGDHEAAVKEFQAALRYIGPYPEARNDMAMVHLDTRYAHSDAKEAVNQHLWAIQLTSRESERQRNKLCSQFIGRASSLENMGPSRLSPRFGHILADSVPSVLPHSDVQSVDVPPLGEDEQVGGRDPVDPLGWCSCARQWKEITSL